MRKIGKKSSVWEWVGFGVILVYFLFSHFSISKTPIEIDQKFNSSDMPEEQPNFNNSLVSESFSYDDYPHIKELHWGKMPIKYTIKNPDVCGTKIVEQIKSAFETLKNETDGKVNFAEETEDPKIFIECTPRYGKNVSIVQQTSNTYAYARVTHVFDDELDNVISRAEVNLLRVTKGNYYGRCGEKPTVILHELLHLFNFEDNGDSTSIMYRYIGNCVEIDEEILNNLKETYSGSSL